MFVYGKRNGTRRCLNGLDGHEDRLLSKPFFYKRLEVNMSRIITHEQCDKCKKEYKDIYISFGHPNKDFEWKWKCTECGCENKRIIKAMPLD